MSGLVVAVERPRLLVRRLRRAGEAWAWFTSMSTAIKLLLGVAGVAAAGSVVPQSREDPVRASQWVSAHGIIGQLATWSGALDLFDSWWFALLVLLLLTSLGACLVGRWLEWMSALPRRHSGRLMRGGSLLFHTSVFLIVAGGVYGHWTGYDGTVNLVQGQTWVDSAGNYDLIAPGPLFQGNLGFAVHVDSVSASYDAQGVATAYRSRLRIIDGGRAVLTATVSPNDKLVYRGVKFYQARYGWAPEIRVSDAAGTLLTDQPVITTGDPAESSGVLKVADTGGADQLAADVTVLPSPQLVGNSLAPAGPVARNPVVALTVYRGDLRLNAPQNIFTLDRSRLTPVWQGLIRLGEQTALPDGTHISFVALRQYTGLTINRDDGVPVVYAGFVLLLVGLVVRAWAPIVMRGRDPLEAA